MKKLAIPNVKPVIKTALIATLTTGFIATNSHAEIRTDGNISLRSHWLNRTQENAPSPFSGVDKDHELNAYINSEWAITDYRRLSAQLGASTRRTDLGDPQKGTRISRASVKYQHGVAPLPYVIETGDFFAQHSSRSLRRNLKGAQIEFQPVGETAQSIQILAGLDSNEWDTAGDASRYLGFSWLAESEPFGALSLGHVFSEDSDHANEQRTSSVAWNKGLSNEQHRLEWEMELLQHSNENTSGSGAFADVSALLWQGKTRFQLAYEQYDDNFNPRGGVTGGGQRRWNAGLSQRTDFGSFNLGASRLNFFLFGNKDSNYQLSYSVNPIAALSLNLSLARRENQSSFGESDSDSSNVSASWAINQHHGIQLSTSEVETNTKDSFGKSKDRRRDITLGWRSSGNLLNGQWNLAPRLSWSESTTNTSRTENVSPALTASFRQDRHDLQLSYGGSRRETDTDGSPDARFNNRRLSARYSYQQPNTRWSIELGRFVSDGNFIDKLEEDSLLLSVEHRFQHVRGEQSTSASNGLNGATSEHQFSPVDPLLALSHLVGTGDFSVAQAVAISANPISQLNTADRSVYQGHFLPGEFEQQQLILESTHGVLTDVHWTIDLQGKSPQDINRLIERTRSQLYAALGAPHRREEFGQANHNVNAAIQNGELQLLNEWQLEGRTLRFGIPRSIDGQSKLRIYFQHHFSNSLEDSWG